MKILKLIISITIPLLIGFFGSIFTSQSINTWYVTLQKPEFNPPNWIFAPVWTILFIFIGISFFWVWQQNFGGQKTKAITIYSIQLILNWLWSILFFGLQKPLYSFIEIIILLIIIIVNAVIFYRITPKAGYILIPYILWVSFASVLNLFIVLLN
jgi:benzodiazapine receptor